MPAAAEKVNKPTLRRMAQTLFDTVAGNGVVASLSRNRSRDHLRILAYHGVDDPGRFRDQMEHLREFYVPVSVDQVLDFLGGAPLPRLAVWVTFDDGYPSVIEQGLPETERLEIPITLFVCPAVIDTDQPLWWQSVMQVQRAAGDSEDLIRHLKERADKERREIVRRLVATAVERGVARPTQPQLTSESLDRLAGTSATIGNHTWDHPTLDSCEPPDQVVQIRRAHSFLRDKRQFRPVLAYPNGNWTLEAETAAQGLGYRLGLLFDHRLTNTAAPRFRWSRLRVASDTPMQRFAAILSGAHASVYHRREAMHGRVLKRDG